MMLNMKTAIFRPVLTAGLAFLVSFIAFAQEGTYSERIAQHRKEKDEEFRDPSESPLDKKGIRKFKGLSYYPPDESYCVKARFILNETPVLFKMPTTTTRLPEYIK